MGRYLKPEKLKTAPSGSIVAVCYFNGLFWVCPDPLNTQEMNGFEQGYRQGYFIEKREYRISPEYYADRTNWNS